MARSNGLRSTPELAARAAAPTRAPANRGGVGAPARLLGALVLAVSASGTPVVAQGTVDADHGVVAIARLMRGLGGTGRVLIVGAHPDDEDTSLLTWVEKGLGGDAAYLSLSRGEGGQNLIGPELGVGLGLIRTGELLAARSIDGAEQYFTRAYDFGYSKSAAETFRFWPRDTLLADVVAVIRRFRPQVLVSVFSGTPRDGHGQHQVAGIVAREAFEVAGDTMAFPEQVAAGLRPWKPLKLYRSTRFDRDASTLEIETGTLDPVYGRSYHQIAMASRSQHRSQDMGRIETLGPQRTHLQLLESRVDVDADSASPFAGIETGLLALAPGAASSASPSGLRASLARYEEQLESIRRSGDVWRAGEALPEELATAMERLRVAIDIAEDGGPELEDLLFELRLEERRLMTLLTEAAGVILDAFADDDLLVPGQQVEVDVQVWNGGARPVEIVGVKLETPAGEVAGVPGLVAPGSLSHRRLRFTIPEDAPLSRAYFLEMPPMGTLYVWPDDYGKRGRPFGPPAVRAVIELTIAGQHVVRELEAVHRFADQARGEVRRPVYVVPVVAVTLTPETSIWPLGSRQPLRYSVELRAEAETEGEVRLEVPAGWLVSPASARFALPAPGTTTSIEFEVEPEAGTLEAGGTGSVSIAAVVEGEAGVFREGYAIIDYPHVRRALRFRPADARVEVFPLAVDTTLRVAFVPGAGTAVSEAMAAMGLDVETLDDRMVMAGDLSSYDVIVLGIRSYETNAALVASNERLLEFVQAGGTVISQYQQYGYFRGNYAPYQLEARFPHDRVADETSPIRILSPDHPVLNTPNRLRPDDFDGWVQERGLYFPHAWDDRYRPVLEMTDPGEEPKRGGLLVCEYGEGVYVYTGLSLFRQLPAGVPGAYRLLANLLSLGR